MSILRRLLPKRADFRFAGCFDDIGEAFRFRFEKFHAKKKSARELRQEGSNYRCCIPALAGFVSPQSIAPDGGEISSHHSGCATRKLGAKSAHGVFPLGNMSTH